MKFLYLSIVLASFIGIAVFGIFGMHLGMQNHDGGCVAATQGTACPKQANPIDYLIFHLDAFKNFSTATFSAIAAALLILSLPVIGVVSRALPWNLASPKLAHYRLGHSDSFRPPSQYGFSRWLALHENSPATL